MITAWLLSLAIGFVVVAGCAYSIPPPELGGMEYRPVRSL